MCPHLRLAQPGNHLVPSLVRVLELARANYAIENPYLLQVLNT
jgi:hypothetical protein